MSKDIMLEAVKKAMRLTGKANLALTVECAIEALDDEEIELIQEDAIAIITLANAIIDKTQEANRRKAEEQQNNSYKKGWK